MTGIGFVHPWWLAALACVLLTLRRRRADEQVFPWNGWLPPDRTGQWYVLAERVVAMLAIVSLVLGLAGIGRSETMVQRVGSGAETVILLDRSASMNAGFAARSLEPADGPEQEPRKRRIARAALADFAAGRPNDVFALVMFSAGHIQAVPFTSQPEVIQAAIGAGAIGPGLGNTNVGSAMLAAIRLFDDRPATGNRILMLVSDGGDRIEPQVRTQIAENLRRNRVTLYWVYLRSPDQPALFDATDPRQDASIEAAMHRYFTSLSTPYRAFEAGSPQAMQEAVAAVSRQQMMPITYQVRVPRVDWSGRCYLIFSLACIALAILRSQYLDNGAPPK